MTRFIARMLPEKRQLFNSAILCLMGASVIWGAGHVSHASLHWFIQTGGLFLAYSGLAPLITRPVGVVTDGIADASLGATKPMRDRLKLWWMLQWHFNGDRQSMDRVMRYTSR